MKGKAALLTILLLFTALALFSANRFKNTDVIAAGKQASIKIYGAVSKEINLTPELISKLPQSVKRVKFLNDSEEYMASFEATGTPLQKALEEASVKKAFDDGFDRELDMYFLVKRRNGKTVIFSYGEIFANNDYNNIMIASSFKFLYPHKHTDFKPFNFDIEKIYTSEEINKIDRNACLACHNGNVTRKTAFPEGICIIAGKRLIEDVIEIKACQCFTSPAHPAEKADRDTMWAEKFDIINEEAKSEEVKVESFSQLSIDTAEVVTVGMGKGFHGKHFYEGYRLDELLKKYSSQKNIDPDNFYVLATALDGYRCLFSGNELFAKEANITLVFAQDLKTPEKGEGRYKVFIKNDFYIDRCVRTLKELSLNIVK